MSYELSDRITLKMLRYFYEVAKSGHFGKAATQLKITSSPLSFQIKELESLLGVDLFYRNSRNVQLTAPGIVLKTECEQIFYAIDRSLSKVKKAGRQQANTLKIGLVSSAFWAGFGGMLKEFRHVHPHYHVEFVELSPEYQKQQLLDQKIDIGLVRFADALNIYPLKSQRITDEEFIVAVSDEHPLKDRKLISIEELKGSIFSFMVRRNSASAELVIDACMNAGFTPSINNEFVEPNTLMAYVASSETITVVPSSFSMHRWDHIRFIKLEEKLPASLCMIYDQRAISPITQAFVDLFDC